MAPSKNRVPDRWESYSPIGTLIPGTRFIACKTPLKPDLSWKVRPGGAHSDREWGLPDLLHACPDLGLLLDLTNTDKYCSLAAVRAKGIEYKRIETHGIAIPARAAVEEFNQVVDDFLSRDETRLIGVTCTYGVNRAGYFICQYMAEQLGFEPDEAIAAFDEARGHRQDRANYLTHLRTGVWTRGFYAGRR